MHTHNQRLVLDTVGRGFIVYMDERVLYRGRVIETALDIYHMWADNLA